MLAAPLRSSLVKDYLKRNRFSLIQIVFWMFPNFPRKVGGDRGIPRFTYGTALQGCVWLETPPEQLDGSFSRPLVLRNHPLRGFPHASGTTGKLQHLVDKSD